MNDESLLGGGYIQTNTFKEQAYELIKDGHPLQPLPYWSHLLFRKQSATN